MIIVKNKILGISSKLYLFPIKINTKDIFKIVSYNFYLGNNKRLPFIHHKSNTIYINLSYNNEELLKQAKSNTRNEIRKAIREDYKYENNIPILQFVTFYNTFANDKKLPKITEQHCLKYGNHLYLSAVKYNNQYLSMHATIYDIETSISRLLYSASGRLNSSADTKIIGIGNRFLHYMDFISLRDLGLLKYDFGGIYTGDKDKSQQGIAHFKASFGGEIAEINSYYSVLYYLGLLFRKILTKLCA